VRHFYSTSVQVAEIGSRAIPESALYEEQTYSDDDDEPQGEDHDDEKTGTRYNVR
jgi:hypothetical protein